MFEKIQAYLASQLDIPADEITRDTTFESLGVDSLDTVEMVMDLEEQHCRDGRFGKGLFDCEHGQFDNIGGSTLDRGVDRRSLGEFPYRLILGVNLRQTASALQQG